MRTFDNAMIDATDRHDLAGADGIGAGNRCRRTPIQAACRSTKLRAPM